MAFQETANKKINLVIPNPRYSDDPNQEVCDLIVQCGSTAIFIEVKGNTIASEAKYSDDLGKIKRELDKKWVGEGNKRRAVKQLVAAIESACNDECPRAIEGIDMRFISTVIPVILTRDEFSGSMGVNTYLNEQFKNVLGRVHYRKSITSLVCICSDTLEKISPYLCDTALSELLSVRLRNDKRLLKPFFMHVAKFLRLKSPRTQDRQPQVLKDATREVFRLSVEILGFKPEGDVEKLL